MSDFNYQQWRTASAVTPAMLDSCLDRIRELEAQRDAYADRAAAVYSERKLRIEAEAELTRLRAVNEALSGVIKQADEELAERDRMLHAVFTESMGLKPGALSEKGWLAYLRARAEGGRKDV